MKEVEVSQSLADAIKQLEDELSKEFGADFSYQIFGRGAKVGALNIVDGFIAPKVRKVLPLGGRIPPFLPR